MAGTLAPAERASALRRLAERSHGRIDAVEPSAGSAAGLHGAAQSPLGLAADLLFGWIFAALAVAMVVMLVASIQAKAEPAPVLVEVPDQRPEVGEDLDPRDPLVICTMLETHTRCAREGS